MVSRLNSDVWMGLVRYALELVLLCEDCLWSSKQIVKCDIVPLDIVVEASLNRGTAREFDICIHYFHYLTISPLLFLGRCRSSINSNSAGNRFCGEGEKWGR